MTLASDIIDMPTYTCTISPGRLSSSQKAEVVKALTRIHSEEGKAPAYLVQAIFHEVAPENHFINGRPVSTEEIWINGVIRAGRTDEQKTAMATRMVKECAAACGIDESYMWVYISDLAKAAEFGSVLPGVGEENQWFAALPEDVKRRYDLGGG